MGAVTPLAALYTAGILAALAGGAWALWWLAIQRAVEWWIARHCPLAPTAEPTAADSCDRWHTELPEIAPARPLDAYEQAILARLEADLARPRPSRWSQP